MLFVPDRNHANYYMSEVDALHVVVPRAIVSQFISILQVHIIQYFGFFYFVLGVCWVLFFVVVVGCVCGCVCVFQLYNIVVAFVVALRE